MSADFFTLRQILALEKRLNKPDPNRINELQERLDSEWTDLSVTERRLAEQVEKTYEPSQRYDVRRD